MGYGSRCEFVLGMGNRSSSNTIEKVKLNIQLLLYLSACKYVLKHRSKTNVKQNIFNETTQLYQDPDPDPDPHLLDPGAALT
jgi:hypothetical protein